MVEIISCFSNGSRNAFPKKMVTKLVTQVNQVADKWSWNNIAKIMLLRQGVKIVFW